MKEIPLTQGKVALVDDEDFDRVNQFKWWADKRGNTYYGRRTFTDSTGRKRAQYIHQFILGVVGVDYRDGDGLNDRRENIRAATAQQNRRARVRKVANATSKYRGVCWHVGGNKWSAQIKVNRRKIHLGLFEFEADAARAYDKAARELFGEFATPNFS